MGSELTEIERLAKALSNQFSEKETFGLAKILSIAHDKATISYQEIYVPSELKDELLMLLHSERLLISMRSSSRGGSAWKDKILSLENQERYHMPRVVWHLIGRAKETGQWDIKYAEEQCLKEVGEKKIGEIVDFLSILKMVTPDHKVTPKIMHEVGTELNMIVDLHQVIDEFTRCGIISAPIQASLHLGSPHYEVNRSLYWNVPQ